MGGLPQKSQALAGRAAWLISDGKAGSESQITGIADGLGLDWALKRVAPTGLTRLIAPWGRPNTRDRFGAPGGDFAPPFPDIGIAIGRRSMPYLRALKRKHPETVTIALLDSKAGRGVADLIWVPQHDRLRGDNVVTSLTAPHGFSRERFAALRRDPPARLSTLPSPRLAILLGGQNAVYRYTADDHQRFGACMATLVRHAGSVLLTPSRRTHQALIDTARAATDGVPRWIYDDEAEPNPYADFLAHADAIVVTADSISMTAEAAATGRPVYVFHPARGSVKFTRFHRALEAAGVTRALTPDVADGGFPAWRPEPRDATAEICRELEARIVHLDPQLRSRRGS
ncbi:MAG: mitochondrial fission ELM1 family protein [Pseudomonadota bacterium]